MTILPTDRRVIGPVELQEYLFAATQANATYPLIMGNKDEERENLTKSIREILRLHRFVVINWLLMSGVSVPAGLLADETHPQVGDQLPDAPSPVA